MNNCFLAWLAAVIAAGALAGCDAPSDPAPAEVADLSKSSSTADEASPDEEPKTKPADVTAVDVAGYEKAIAAHKGNVVLVDFWATWCVPCIERFPETVEWSKKYASDGLKVISMSFDDEGPHVGEFLAEHSADIQHLRSQWGTGTESVEQFKVQGGGVPYYRLYDRQGELRYEFSGSPEGLNNVEALEQIEPRLKELLAEKT
jgi:thiol-disulfide isomerase/thioredoxin